MESDEGEDRVKIDTEKNLFKAKVKKSTMWQNYGSEDESQSDQDEESEDESAHEQNVFKTEPLSKIVEKELSNKSAFRISIQNQQLGIAYLILGSKYDYMLAMQDALDDRKFNLVLTLLSKTADYKVVQRKNALNQNLMHILAKNSSGGQ